MPHLRWPFWFVHFWFFAKTSHPGRPVFAFRSRRLRPLYSLSIHQDTTGKHSFSHSAMSDPHFLVITKGHPFEKGPFFEMLDGLDGQYTHVEQPLAASILGPELMRPYDCLVFYDMPGINFESRRPNLPGTFPGF